MSEVIEMSHSPDGTRYAMIKDTKIDGGVQITVEGMPINGSWWQRLRVALRILFRPGTIRSVNVAIMANVIAGGVTVEKR